MEHPAIIQGGMGVGVSTWRLARAVSRAGHLGVVSGTALDALLACRLQSGDPGGHMRRAMRAFPIEGVAERVERRYFIPGGNDPDRPFEFLPKPRVPYPTEHLLLLILANFVEVYLAKEGHDGRVGINFLEKIQVPILPSLYGAMLAGVDDVLMGAGIPREIPGALDALAAGQPASLTLRVEGPRSDEPVMMELDPAAIPGAPPPPARPRFIAIVSSSTLATSLARKSTGTVDGFVVELPEAGGHNAPPRGPMNLNERGEPLYGPRDDVDLEKIRALGLPFWIGGACGNPSTFAEVLARGATGIQVGTAFALCEESELNESIRAEILRRLGSDEIDVRTDPLVSPTGFPFKVVQLPDTLSDPEVYAARPRICDLGYLRTAYRREDGSVGWRCPSEDEQAYVRKGGAIEDVRGRACVCHGLMATAGFAQIRRGGAPEPPIATSGTDFRLARACLDAWGSAYSAVDVINTLTKGLDLETMQSA